MDLFLGFIPYYLCLINAIAAAVCIFDKIQAKRHGRRTSEKMLFFLSAAGGSVGLYTAMRLIRHKTLHKRFMIGLPVIIFLQVSVIIIFVLWQTGILQSII